MQRDCVSLRKRKPGVRAVSVGLLDALEGARAGTWLDWWTQRIGFQEKAPKDRPCRDKYEEDDVILAFAKGLHCGVKNVDRVTE